MPNPGNTGHGGYRMQTVIAIQSLGDMVTVTLRCKHVQLWEPGYGHTAEEWARFIQQGERPLEVDKTRLRCEQCRPSSNTPARTLSNNWRTARNLRDVLNLAIAAHVDYYHEYPTVLTVSRQHEDRLRRAETLTWGEHTYMLRYDAKMDIRTCATQST